MMRKFLSLLLSTLVTASAVSAHSAHSHQASTSAFTASSESKFAINSESGHIGHFYLRRVKTTKNTEVLYVKQTFHFEEDITKNTKAKYDKNTGLLSYSINIPEMNQKYFLYINLDNLDGTSNDGYRVVIDTSDGSVSSEAITLSVIAPEASDGHSHN